MFETKIKNSFVCALLGSAAVAASPALANDFCASEGQVTSYEWIDAVAVDGVASSTGNNNGYLEVSSPSYTLEPGVSHDLSLTPGYAYGAYNEHWAVWVDLDQSGTFDADEKLYQGSSYGGLSGSLDIPADAVPGETTMRVSMRYGSGPSACGTFYYGEVEDYDVTVLGGGPVATTTTIGFEEPITQRMVISGLYTRNGEVRSIGNAFYVGSAHQREVTIDVDPGTEVEWTGHIYPDYNTDLVPAQCSDIEGPACFTAAGAVGEAVIFTIDDVYVEPPADGPTDVLIGFDAPHDQDLVVIASFTKDGIAYGGTYAFWVGMDSQRTVSVDADPGTTITWRAEIYLEDVDLPPVSCSQIVGNTCVMDALDEGESAIFAPPAPPMADQVLDFEDAFGGTSYAQGPSVDIDGVLFTTSAPYFYNHSGSPFGSDYLAFGWGDHELTFSAPVQSLSFDASGSCTNCTQTVTVTADGQVQGSFDVSYGAITPVTLSLPAGTTTVGFDQNFKIDDLAIDYE